MKRRSRVGFSLLELLVVIAIIAILLALIVAGLQYARESANRVYCANNLKQIGIALHTYHHLQGKLPPAFSHPSGYSPPPPPDQAWYIGWMARILPYLEGENVYRRIDWKRWPFWQGQTNGYIIPLYRCPSDRRQYQVHFLQGGTVALTAYLGVSGTNQDSRDGLLYPNSQVCFRDITDGLGTTLLAGERPPSSDMLFGWWFAGAGQDPRYSGSCDVVLGTRELRTTGYSTNSNCPKGPYAFGPGDIHKPCDMFHFWSLHGPGSNFLMADGSVHWIPYAIPPDVLAKLGTRAGGEDVPSGLWK